MRADRIRKGRAIAGLFGAAVLASCAVPAPPDPNANGAAPTFVSLNPCIDAMLVEIAASDQILALSHYSRDPGSSSMDPDVAAGFAYTGGTAEEVLALQPDIVLASSFIAPTTRTALERAGLRVETFGSPAAVPQSLAQIRELAALTGREAEGEALVERISDALAQFPSVPADQSVTAMLWQPGQIVPGEATLVWEHFARFGLVNHAASMGLGQAGFVSLETVLANPPDLLLIAGDQPGQTHPLLSQLDQTFVARFEPNLFYCGGPSIIRAQERLTEIREAFMTNPPGGITHDAR